MRITDVQVHYFELPTGPGFGADPNREDLARNPYRTPAHF